MHTKNIWKPIVLPIAAIFSFRMLGLFMLIPVFTIYASQLKHATPQLIGLALGGYGLTQGLLQIPFGILSDRYGRKSIITAGLLFFMIGSILGAVTTSIYGMILARIFQGMGAIGSVLIALLADLTPDESRTKAMAVIGVTIGISFSIAMVASPTIAHHYGLAGIFYFTAGLAALGLLLLHYIIPTPEKQPFHLDSQAKPNLIKSVLANPDLRRLDIGIFCQHFILTATFFSIPIQLQQLLANGLISKTWHFYLPLMVLSFLAMVPFIIVAEKKNKMKMVFVGAIVITMLGQSLLAVLPMQWLQLFFLLFIYFVAFNILEASLPSLISKQADAQNKGTAMGVYSSCQFFGLFVGGVSAGFFYNHYGHQGIFIINALVALFWLVMSYPLRPNMYMLTMTLPYDGTPCESHVLSQQLLKIPGIIDVSLSEQEKCIYLRINKAEYQTGSAEKIITKLNSGKE